MMRPIILCTALMAGALAWAAVAAIAAETVPVPAETRPAGDNSAAAAQGPSAAPGESPAPEPSPEQKSLAEGWRLTHMANYAKAQEAFKAAGQSADREVQAEALFALAMLWQVRQPDADAAKAARLYRQVFEEFKDSRAAPWATLSVARLLDLPPIEKDRKVDEARRLYEQVLAAWPEHPAADEAALRLGLGHLERVGDRAAEDRGVEVLTKRLAARPDNALAAAMHMLLGNLRERRQEYRPAIEHWTAADEAGIPGLQDRATLYYKIAHAAEYHLQDYGLAVRWYGRIVREIQRDAKYYPAKLAVERCRQKAADAGRPIPASEEAPPLAEAAP